MDENEIKKRLKNGDIAALEVVYREFSDKLYSYALWLSKSAATAEDEVSDVFIKLYNYISGGRQVNSIKSFLYVSLRNALYDNFKLSVRYTTIDHSINSSSDMNQRLIVEEALNKLSLDEREVILLHHYGGFLHREIALILDIPEGTIRWRYSKALKKLRTMLGGTYND